MSKKFFKIIKSKKVIILFLIIVLSLITIKLVTLNDQSIQNNTTYIITDNKEDLINDSDNEEDTIGLKEESLLGEWEFDTDIQNKAYSKPSKIKLNFKNNSDVVVDVYLLDHGDYLTNSNSFKYKIKKDKNGETYICILFNVDPSRKDSIDPKYTDCMFKFIIKEIEKNKINVELKYTSKESKKEILKGSLLKSNY